MERVKVLLSDDQLLVKEAWHILFSKQEIFSIAGESSTTDETVAMVEKVKPDIIMFEINMPGTGWLETIQKLKQDYPEVIILIVSVIKDTTTVITALRNGASGFVTKNSSAEEVFKALSQVSKGHKYVCDELNEALIEEIARPKEDKKRTAADMFESLTPSEKKVIAYLQEGINSKQIAELMNLSTRTIEVHRYHILKKMQQPSTMALISFLNKNKISPNGIPK